MKFVCLYMKGQYIKTNIFLHFFLSLISFLKCYLWLSISSLLFACLLCILLKKLRQYLILPSLLVLIFLCSNFTYIDMVINGERIFMKEEEICIIHLTEGLALQWVNSIIHLDFLAFIKCKKLSDRF